jgi:hypothetical protein
MSLLEVCQAQEKHYLGLSGHLGTLMPHHPEIAYHANGGIQGIELNYAKQNFANSFWDSIYHFPRYGAGYFFSNLSNNDVFGKIHSLHGFIDIPLSPNTGKYDIFFRFGFGLSYLTRAFNLEDNYLNTAIGSKTNIFVRLGLKTSFEITPDLLWTNSFNFSHTSNGNLKTPNLGLNVLSYSTGVLMGISSSSRNTPPAIKTFFPGYEWMIGFSGGARTYKWQSSRYFRAIGINMEFGRRFSYKHSAGGGIDFFKNNSLRAALKEDSVKNVKDIDTYQAGIHLYSDLHFKRIVLTFNIGTYIYSRYKYTFPMYNRLGFRYKINRRWLANFTIKSHLSRADYLEFGITYKVLPWEL